MSDLLNDPDRRRLCELLPEDGTSGPWTVSDIRLDRLRVMGNDRARALRLSVRLSLVGTAPEQQHHLCLCLDSDRWACAQPGPPVHVPDGHGPVVPGEPDTRLTYSISDMRVSDVPEEQNRFWMKYIYPEVAHSGLVPDGGRDDSLGDEILQRLSDWIGQTLRVDHVGGAVDCALTGPAGFFGPVEHQLLERSGQLDLEVDATRLAALDNDEDTGGEGTTFLTLYGERHGRWLLHRRTALVRKARRRENPPPTRFQCDVQVADSADEMITLAGLGDLQKRLFARADILPSARLQEDTPTEPAKEPTSLDVSAIPERSRRYVQALVGMAQQGQLTSGDLDVILRLARHVGRRKP
ncbi:MAG: hypothetical protein ACQETO_06420 [Pseudomonadota bacterium]